MAAKQGESGEFHQRLADLRQEMTRMGVDGFLLPVTDDYQGEYSATYARRVTWLTGFDGSAGAVLVLKDKAALFVDGRYTLQAAQEVDAKDYTIFNSAEKLPAAYAKDEMGEGAKLGYDPWLHTPQQIIRIELALSGHNISLLPLPENPLDAAWKDQPARPIRPLSLHSIEHAGKPFTEKLAEASAVLAEKHVESFIVALPESLCWLLNIRGDDIPYNPLPLARGVLQADGSLDLFIEAGKLTPAVTDALRDYVRFHPPEAMEVALKTAVEKGSIGLDPEKTPIWFVQAIEARGGHIVEVEDPAFVAKSIKNSVESDGIRRAHVIDGAAVTRFLCWFDTLSIDDAPSELEIADRLENFRRRSGDYQGPSFATIAGSGPNGAIVHYRASEKSSRKVASGDILLLDSGGQYPFGTTDVTRTTARGEVSDEFKRHFTLVLKGHIALAQARFPEGTSGGQLDVLARLPLWQNGLDYDHGTGHGVGCYLCVHEGPQRISKRGGDVALKPGMILSNEPGFYPAGEYGIRIENLVLTVDKAKAANGKRSLGFETLTLAPINPRLIELKLLDASEKAWLNSYHTRVIEQVGPLLDGVERDWLVKHARMI